MSKTITVTFEQEVELMKLAFTQICNKTNWKLPIDAIVPISHVTLYSRAITFMTGATVHAIEQPKTPMMVRLTSLGYYGGAGA